MKLAPASLSGPLRFVNAYLARVPSPAGPFPAEGVLPGGFRELEVGRVGTRTKGNRPSVTAIP